MPSGHKFAADPAQLASAHRSVARNATALAALTVEVERLRDSAATSTETLDRPEAVAAADEAASFLSLAADALRDGSRRLAALEDDDLTAELLSSAAGIRACGP